MEELPGLFGKMINSAAPQNARDKAPKDYRKNLGRMVYAEKSNEAFAQRPEQSLGCGDGMNDTALPGLRTLLQK